MEGLVVLLVYGAVGLVIIVLGTLFYLRSAASRKRYCCPKCGEHMVEHEFDIIKAERCESCGLVSMDKGEIELLLSSDKDHILAYRIKGLLQ